MLPDINREDLITFCQELIRCVSLSGNEEKAANLILEKMQSLGFDEAWIDEKGSVIGKITGQGDKTILFDGHIDTVPVSDSQKWKYPPYGGLVEDGRIYGRGASDMKGALAAMIIGLGTLAKIKDQIYGHVFVSGTVFEEFYEGAALKDVVDTIQPDYVIIGEASELNVQRGQRGRAEIKLTTYGKSAHSANPQFGVNALKEMVKLLPYLEGLNLPFDNFLGQAIIEPTDIITFPFPGASVVPEKCAVTFDRRLLTGEQPNEVLQQIESYINKLKEDDQTFQAEVIIAEEEAVCYTGSKFKVSKYAPAWEVPPEHCLVQNSLKALNNIGQNPTVGKYSFCTNGSYSAGVAGIPTIGYGPSRENQAHVTDEYIEVEQIVKVAQGYRAIALAMLNS